MLFRLMINNSLDEGTQLPYIRKALGLGYGVVVLNTNDNKSVEVGALCLRRPASNSNASEKDQTSSTETLNKTFAKLEVTHFYSNLTFSLPGTFFVCQLPKPLVCFFCK